MTAVATALGLKRVKDGLDVNLQLVDNTLAAVNILIQLDGNSLTVGEVLAVVRLVASSS